MIGPTAKHHVHPAWIRTPTLKMEEPFKCRGLSDALPRPAEGNKKGPLVGDLGPVKV